MEAMIYLVAHWAQEAECIVLLRTGQDEHGAPIDNSIVNIDY